MSVLTTQDKLQAGLYNEFQISKVPIIQSTVTVR